MPMDRIHIYHAATPGAQPWEHRMCDLSPTQRVFELTVACVLAISISVIVCTLVLR